MYLLSSSVLKKLVNDCVSGLVYVHVQWNPSNTTCNVGTPVWQVLTMIIVCFVLHMNPPLKWTVGNAVDIQNSGGPL